MKTGDDGQRRRRDNEEEDAPPAVAAETEITVAGSEYGPMLWASKRQAVYVSSVTAGTCLAATENAQRHGRPS